ncbi:MAG: TIGR03435 family protein [Ignavibacteriota bacterium]
MQRERLLALAAVALSVTTALAQRPEFDVASVKVNTTDGDMDLKPHRSGDLVIMHNTQLYAMIFYAYHLTDNYQLTGFVPFSPNETNWFDVEARIGREATDDEVRLMFQSLIEERFKVKMHRETREMPVYELTLGKGKPRLTPSRPGPDACHDRGKALQPACWHLQ